MLGAFVVLITPCLVHYKTVADTSYDRTIDVLIIIYAIIIGISLAVAIIVLW